MTRMTRTTTSWPGPPISARCTTGSAHPVFSPPTTPARNRVDSYLAGAADLPDETVNYVAAITPNLGNSVPLSGPLAMYASSRGGRGSRFAPSVASLAAGCDLNAAYDPNHPCTSLMQAAAAPAPVQLALAPQTGVGGCDLSAAYDPSHPCTSAGRQAVAAAASPARHRRRLSAKQRLSNRQRRAAAT